MGKPLSDKHKNPTIEHHQYPFEHTSLAGLSKPSFSIEETESANKPRSDPLKPSNQPLVHMLKLHPGLDQEMKTSEQKKPHTEEKTALEGESKTHIKEQKLHIEEEISRL